MGDGAAPYHVDDRQRHRDQERLQDPDGDDAGHGDGRDGDLDPAGAGQAPPGAGFTMPMAAATMTPPRVALGRYRIGSVRNTSTRAMTAAASRPESWVRAPIWSLTAVRDPLRPDREPLGDPGGQAGRAHGAQLGVGDDVLAAAAGEGAGDQDLVGVADEEDAEGRRQQRQGVARVEARALDAGQARGDLADHGHAVGGQPEGGRGDDRGDHHDQGPGSLRKRQRRPSSTAREAAPTARVAAVPVAEVAEHRDQRRDRALGLGAEAEQLAELADDQDHGDPVEVADQHRPGEVVGDPAQPDQPCHQEHGPDQQRQQRGQGRGPLRVLGRERHHRRRRPGRRSTRPAR